MSWTLAAAGLAKADGLICPLWVGRAITIGWLAYTIVCPLYWCLAKKPSWIAFLLTALPLVFVLLGLLAVFLGHDFAVHD